MKKYILNHIEEDIGMKYKRKAHFQVTTVADDKIIMARGAEAIKFNGVIVPNESFMILWEKLLEYCEKDELSQLLVDKYGIDLSVAIKDVDNCIKKMLEYQLLDTKM